MDEFQKKIKGTDLCGDIFFCRQTTLDRICLQTFWPRTESKQRKQTSVRRSQSQTVNDNTGITQKKKTRVAMGEIWFQNNNLFFFILICQTRY